MKSFVVSAWPLLAAVALLVLVEVTELVQARSHQSSGRSISTSKTVAEMIDEPDSYPSSADFDKPFLEVLKTMTNSKESGERKHVKALLDDSDWDESTTGMTTVDLLTRCGFNYELHECRSTDGYTTQLVRIVNPKVKREHLRKTPVVLYAGQGASPAAFLVASLNSVKPSDWQAGGADSDEHLLGEVHEQVGAENRSLAAMLSNNGFDVWLVPARGVDEQNRARAEPDSGGPSDTEDTKASHEQTGADGSNKEDGANEKENLLLAKKVALKEKMFTASFDLAGPLRKLVQKFAAKNYWSFSSDEIIEHEFKLQLETVRTTCNSEKVSLISYSNGGFISFGFLSKEPAYARRHLDAVVSLAPAVFVNKFNVVLGVAGFLSHLNPPVWPFPEDHIDDFIHKGLIKLCKNKAMRYSACKLLLNQIYGPSDLFSAHLELSTFDQIGRPMSANGLRQTLQATYAGKMRRYDHGYLGNLVCYGKPEPSEYNLKAVDLEYLFVFTGSQDAIADSNSITQLVGSIGCKPQVSTQIPGYNHLDLLVGHDNAERVNLPVLKILIDRDIELGYLQSSEDDHEHGNSKHEDANVDNEHEKGEHEDTNDEHEFRHDKNKRVQANNTSQDEGDG